MNEFDITSTYTKGDIVIYNNEKYVFDPQRWQCQFIFGFFPKSNTLPYGRRGWKLKLERLIDEMFKDYDLAIISMENKNHGRIMKSLPCSTDSEPNEPTVLECKDKMINEI